MTGAAAAERCNMLWIGPRLGPLERACIRSVLRQGHALTLWCYHRIDGVPDGVDRQDARAVLGEDQIVRHHGGSVSLFSNRFRYELQRRGHGIWLDSDMYLLRPIPVCEHLLTEWAPGRINGAVLRLPAESPLLPPLLELFDQKMVPPWLPWRARLVAWWRLRWSGSADLSLMPWGVAGPLALTALVHRLGLGALALPAETFHPYDWTEADWLLDPRRRLADRATAATIGVHLWNERIKHFKDDPAPAGSFLARLQREGA